MATTVVNGNNVLDISICQDHDCSSFNITETSGVYSSSNSGGYGAPNFEISDAINATISITLPDTTQITLTVFPTLPDSSETTVKTITSSDLGLSGSLPDGIYIIKYTVDFLDANSQTEEYTITKTVLFSCSIKCCIDKLIAKIPESNCSCDDQSMKNAILAFSLYKALISSGKCGNITSVTNLLERLNKLCSKSDCGCGS